LNFQTSLLDIRGHRRLIAAAFAVSRHANPS
jgi:hypothetical protein